MEILYTLKLCLQEILLYTLACDNRGMAGEGIHCLNLGDLHVAAGKIDIEFNVTGET